MGPELIDSYRIAESVARSRSNFYYSFIVVPAEKRRALCAVYAFMRTCDDISDGDSGDGDVTVEARRARLRQWRTQLDAVLSGDAAGNPIFPAFLDTVRRYRIPAEHFHQVIDGAEMDLDVSGYQTFDELYKYCFNVASAVGLVCLHIFGFTDQRARKYAEQCGIAFQLTNILRDIREDADMGRVYLPQEDLGKFGCSEEDLRSAVFDDRFRALMRFQMERAREYYAAARNLLPLVDETSKPALWAMIEIYEGILDKIEQRGFDVFTNRVRLSGRQKGLIAARALAMRLGGVLKTVNGVGTR